MSPEFEQIRSKRAFLVPLSVAVAAAISACGGGTKTETVHEPGQVRTIHEVATPHHKRHHGPTVAEEAEREIKEEEAREREVEEEIAEKEAEGSLEARPGGAGAPAESTHYSHGSHGSHSSHSSHVSSYGGEYGGGHYSHSSHSSHSSHYSSG